MQISLRLGLGLRLVLQLGLVSSYYNLASDLSTAVCIYHVC